MTRLLREAGNGLLTETGSFLDLDEWLGPIRGNTQTNESAGALSVTVTKPTGISNGHVLIATSTATSTPSALTDFTLVKTISASGQFLSIWKRVVTGAEAASYVFTQSASGRISAQITAFSNVNASTEDATSVSASVVSSTSGVLHPGVTTANPYALVLGCFALDSSTSTNVNKPTEMTQIWKSTSGTGKIHIFAEEKRVAAGPTGSRQWIQSSGSALDSTAIHMALRAA